MAALQTELDEYIAGYSFGVRRGGGAVAVDPVKKIALGLARDAVKKALVAKGQGLKDYTAETICGTGGRRSRAQSKLHGKRCRASTLRRKRLPRFSLGDLLGWSSD